MSYTIQEAKKNLNRLLEEAVRGHKVVITRNGEAVAELVSLRKADATRGQRRQPGTLKGRIAYTDDAFAPLNKKEWKDMGFE